MDATEAPDGASAVISDLKSLALTPFSSKMNLPVIFWTTGLVIVFAILWIHVLHETLGEI